MKTLMMIRTNCLMCKICLPCYLRMVLPQISFSVIDLASAFNQLFLDDESSELLTINTRKGLFRSKRLCFGVKTATAQFQRVMDAILSGIRE